MRGRERERSSDRERGKRVIHNITMEFDSKERGAAAALEAVQSVEQRRQGGGILDLGRWLEPLPVSHGGLGVVGRVGVRLSHQRLGRVGRLGPRTPGSSPGPRQGPRRAQYGLAIRSENLREAIGTRIS